MGFTPEPEGDTVWELEGEGVDVWAEEGEGAEVWKEDAEGTTVWAAEGEGSESWTEESEGAASWTEESEGTEAWAQEGEGVEVWADESEGAEDWIEEAEGDETWTAEGEGDEEWCDVLWGDIAGTIANQADLQAELDAKVDLAGDTMTGRLNIAPAAASGEIRLFEASSGGSDYVRLWSGSTYAVLERNTGTLALQWRAEGNLTIFEGAEIGENPEVRIWGWLGFPTYASKYISFQVDDTDDFFHIAREDDRIGGLSVDMPMKVTGALTADLTGDVTGDISGATGVFSTSVNTPELYNSAGDLKLEPDVQGDVVLFGDTDVGDAVDGKSLYVYRKAAEGDNSLRSYIDADRVAHFGTDAATLRFDLPSGAPRYVKFGSSDIVDNQGTYVNFYSGGTGAGIGTEVSWYMAGNTASLRTDFPYLVYGMGLYGKTVTAISLGYGGAYSAPIIRINPNSTTGQNKPLRIYGYITAASAAKYASLAVLDTDDYFHIAREDANILGLKVDMPLYADLVRANSSVWYATDHVALINASPGGSGPDMVLPDANTLGGWNLDVDAEYVYFTAHAHPDWDAASDILVELEFEVDVDNTGGLVGDVAVFDLLCYYKSVGDTANKTQTPTVSVTVGQSPRYKRFTAVLTIDYNLGGNLVDAGDVIAMRLNFDATSSSITDVVANHVTIKRKTAKVHEEV